MVVGFRGGSARRLLGAAHYEDHELPFPHPLRPKVEISIFGELEGEITQHTPLTLRRTMVDDHEVIVISDSEDEEESIAMTETETETESIEHTVEWLDSPSHTIGSLERIPYEDLDESFDVLDQSFMDETDPCDKVSW